MKRAPSGPTLNLLDYRFGRVAFGVFFGLDAVAAFGFLINPRLGAYFAIPLVAWMGFSLEAMVAFMILRYRRKTDALELQRMYSYRGPSS
jgi:hypothetical protein